MKLQKALTRYFTLLVLPSALVVGVFLRFAPPQHNPFMPLDLNNRPGLASHFKMTQLERHPAACFDALDSSGVLYTVLDDSPRGAACGLYDALTLDRSLTPYSATLSMTCSQTASLYMWERHVARPAAVEIFGSPLARIETYGSFSCRNIAGTARKSEHAGANAVDISGFRLANGRLINVKTHWDKGGPEDRFLKRVHKGACRIFSVTLGPDYNAAHADHFHFDMGDARTCE
ncbi:extensin family protein [Hyphomonas sp.]|uniref:extensin-like domain-containing protein n=1 Tax=Hyphomonas sp. TaxID=87 RepID=UPI00391D9A25